MRQVAAGLVLLGLAVLMGRADDTPAPKRSSVYDDAPVSKNSPIYDFLNKEFALAQAKHAKELAVAQKAVGEAKTNEKKQEAEKKLEDIERATSRSDLCRPVPGVRRNAP